MNITQALTGQSVTLTLTLESDEGTVTIGIVDANGDAVVASGTAVTDNSDGTYEYTLAAQDDPALLTATWTVAGGATYVTYVEVVGALLFSESAARAFEDSRLSDTTKFPDADISNERARITDWLETQTGRSWIPRYRRATLRGNSTDLISLADATKSEGASGGEGALMDISQILSVTVGGVAQTVANFEIEGWRLWHTTGSFPWARRPNIVIEYVYGLPHPRDGADRIGLLELVERLPASRLDRAATTSTDEFGSYGWDPQNNGRPSRVPEVNAWCRDHDVRVALA